jgi:hypothetical protein
MEIFVHRAENLRAASWASQVTQQSEAGRQDLPLMKHDNLLKCGGIPAFACLNQAAVGSLSQQGAGVQTGVFDHQVPSPDAVATVSLRSGASS